VEKFFDKNTVDKSEVFDLARKALSYFEGEDVNIDIEKLAGKWEGFYRIRKGKIRIIAEFDFDNAIVFIDEIDWRGSVYL